MLERPNICYIFENAWGPRMLNMTFPCVNPIQLGPSPFSLFLRLQKKISHCSQVSGAYFGKNVKPVGNCGTTYLGPRSKYNCSLFFSTFYVERPVSRYGRLKLKFLCERFSHCIYSFWSIELTRTRNTWSITAVPIFHPVLNFLPPLLCTGTYWAASFRAFQRQHLSPSLGCPTNTEPKQIENRNKKVFHFYYLE